MVYAVIGTVGLVVGLIIGLLFGAYLASTHCTKLNYQRSFEVYQMQLFESALKENRSHNITLDGYFLRKGYRKIVIYGLGVYYQEFLKDISDTTFDDIYLADKNVRTLSTSGKRVHGITEIARQDFYDCIVITSYNHAREIERELRELGIKKEIISYRDLVINATKEERS